MNLSGWLTVIATSVVVSLAAAFVARLVTRERGPYAIFSKVRGAAFRLLRLGKVGRELHELVLCPYCLSVWLCLIGALLAQNAYAALVAPMLAWVWIEASGTPAIPDDSE